MKFFVLPLIGLTWLLSACSSNVNSEHTQSTVTKWAETQSMEGRLLRWLSNKEQSVLLASSEQNGVMMFSKTGKWLAQTESGDTKVIDTMVSSSGVNWLTWFDEQRMKLQLSRIAEVDAPMVSLEISQHWAAPVTAMCFDQASQPLSDDWAGDWMTLWVADESGMASQLLLQASQATFSYQVVRQVPVGEGVTACAMASNDRRVMFAQQGIGVFSLNADEETDEERRLLVAEGVDGFHEVTDLVSSKQGVYITTDQGGWLLDSEDKLQKLVDWSSLDDVTSAAFVAGDNDNATAGGGQGRWLMVTDEGATIWQQPKDSNAHQVVTDTPPLMTDTTITLLPTGQTQAVDSIGDAADDPEIWVNQAQPAASLIFGTDKKKGLWVYDLKGEAKQFLPVGRVNNVDVRYGVEWKGEVMDIAMTTNRTTNNVDLFSIDVESGEVALLTQTVLDDSLGEPYGGCLQQGDDAHSLYVWVNNKSGEFQQWKVDFSNQQITNTMTRRFSIATQPEGCAVDETYGRMILGEEDHGLWVVGTAFDQEPDLRLMDKVGGGHLVADVEGVTVYKSAAGHGYIVVSSQGDNAYAVYDRQTLDYVGRFRVGLNGPLGIDGSSETDGLAVVSANLGGDFEQGLLVVQDGRNRFPDAPQNFKLVPWGHVVDGLHLPRK